MINLFDEVEILEDLIEKGITRGTRGTVVHVFTEPTLAFEIELVGSDGSTLATLSLKPHQIRKISTCGQ